MSEEEEEGPDDDVDEGPRFSTDQEPGDYGWCIWLGETLGWRPPLMTGAAHDVIEALASQRGQLAAQLGCELVSWALGTCHYRERLEAMPFCRHMVFDLDGTDVSLVYGRATSGAFVLHFTLPGADGEVGGGEPRTVGTA